MVAVSDANMSASSPRRFRIYYVVGLVLAVLVLLTHALLAIQGLRDDADVARSAVGPMSRWV